MIFTFRWSAIAAKLPGRTDNEIKNVWHTNLKKRLLKSDQSKPSSKRATKPKIVSAFYLKASKENFDF